MSFIAYVKKMATQSDNTKLKAFITQKYLDLARFDEVFQYPKPKSKTLTGITQEIAPGFDVYKHTDNSSPAIWIFRAPDTKIALLMDNGHQVWINVAAFLPGISQGSAIYAIAAGYARNNNKVFIVDPSGLSPMAYYRRLENMISSALKYQSTAHLQPCDPYTNTYKYYVNYGLTGVELEQFTGKRLLWKDDDFQFNLIEMLRLAYTLVSRDFPDIKYYEYDTTKQQFIDLRTNAAVDRADLAKAFGESLQRSPRSNSGGGATAARAILCHTLLRKLDSGRLDHGGKFVSGKRPHPSLRRIFY
ncbi:MAG: hypothetical protein LBG61_05390 [Burkholderiales bacterium]|jgi:hypothetical protein|nr:hypothetical protein [Burkholderiales bacterium]